MRSLLVIVLITIAANFYFADNNDSKAITAESQDSIKVISQEPHMARLDELINTLLSRYHYKKFDLNDSLSSVIFDRYIRSLDYNRSFFYASDIKDFDQYRFRLDDDFKDGDLNPEYKIYNIFMERLNNRIDYVHELLKKEFDFTKNENFYFRRDSADWISSEDEMNELWRKRVKNDALNLILAGKNWPSIDTLLTKRYENYRRTFNQLNSKDVFQIAMNSYTESIDPHTTYLSPVTTDNFKIDMARSLEGIGAQLTTEDEYTKVAQIIAGGPAFKSNKLHNGDRITAVAQGDDGEMVDVIGWRLNDVVQLIRGAKGTVVRLLILPSAEGANAVAQEIKLVRDKVKLEEMSAKRDTLDITNDKVPFRFGVITLPAFYSDFEGKAKGDADYKSTTKDVKNLIEQLNKEKVDGVIIDLRNNGGGSLQEVISLTGLFIKQGPVVQVRNADGSIEVGKDPDPSIVYDGPMAVMVNRFSASASEIFTAAIQDYNRGLIIGENTYGKGTVQNGIDLNRLVSESENKFGQINLTIAKYYRIDGSSTQRVGIVPDIEFPSPIDANDFGESSEPSALKWDKINPTDYKLFEDLSSFLPKLKLLSKQRTESDPEFDYIKEDIFEYRESIKNNYLSLNEEIRKREKEELEEKRFQRENERRKIKGLKLLEKGETPPEDEGDIPDAFLNESAHIIADLIELSIG